MSTGKTHGSKNPKLSSAKGPVLRGYHVLRNYLKNKALCAIVSVSKCIRNVLRDNCVHLDYVDTRCADR